MEAYKQTCLHPHSQPEDYVFPRNRSVSCQHSSSDGGELFSSSLAVSLLNNLTTGTFIFIYQTDKDSVWRTTHFFSSENILVNNNY